MAFESPSVADRPNAESMIVCESLIGRTILGPDPVAFQRWEQQRQQRQQQDSDPTASSAADVAERTQKTENA